MAVERLTDYTRRIWTALGPDAPEGHDIHVNDVIYYMDSSQCGIVTYVYPEGSIDVEFLPDVGGGGGALAGELVRNVYMLANSATRHNLTTTYPVADNTRISMYRYRTGANHVIAASVWLYDGHGVLWSEDNLQDMTYNGVSIVQDMGTYYTPSTNTAGGRLCRFTVPLDTTSENPIHLIF